MANPDTSKEIDFLKAKQQLKTLLEYVNTKGRISASDASTDLGIDSKTLMRLAEALRKNEKVKIHTHYLKEPEFESVDFREEKQKLVEKEQPEKVATAKTDIPRTRKPLTGEKHDEVLESYVLTNKNVRIDVEIKDTGDFVPHYLVSIPKVDFVTRALLDETKRALIGEVQVESREVFDSEKFAKLKQKFTSRATEKLFGVLKKANEQYISTLSQLVVNEMIGLGDIEYLLLDDNIEEVVVNSSRDVVWTYHKKYSWLKTNVIVPTEELIKNYSSRIAREIGREITHLNPLLDAHLTTGDRVNATLYPISTQGNTITIRRFSRTPWTIINLLKPDVMTSNVDVSAFLWLAIEHEISMMVAGGTASGKTTMLNALMPFMPANQRIISLEDTRELNLPNYLQWVPLTIRPPTPEGEGEVSMLHLLQNSLRMRPDRVIVGEVRAKAETEVLFEAMHTGHSVYSTFHAERAREVVDRIIAPPMSIPPTVLNSLQLIIVQFRNRRTRQRRTFEIVELVKDESPTPTLNQVYRWDPKSDSIIQSNPSIRVAEELELFSGMTQKEMAQELADKKMILQWLLNQDVCGVNEVGRVITEYYLNKDAVIGLAEKGGKINFEV
ncbi:MAG TPA: hypothetical protein ENN13_03810 [Candidatus Altiarchaeales archaeon]|nr:hypothetical protein [Candidatus Altiarchaeales archaeon]